MRISIVYIVLFLFSATFRLAGQDFQLSQYHAAPMYLNPGLTGMFEGKYRAHMHTRSQWATTMTKSYQTNMVAFDMPVTIQSLSNRFSAGAMIMNNRAGSGGFNILNVILAGSYHYKFPGKDDHNISGGLQLGFMNKSIRMDKLIFNSQYDPAGMGNLNPEFDNGEIFSSNNVFLPDLNAGILYFYSGNSRFHPTGGVAILHIIPAKESFYDNDNALPRRFVYFAGTRIFINSSLYMSVQGMAMHQGNAKEFLFDLSGTYRMKEKKQYVTFGPAYRVKDALIFYFAYKYDRYTARISYDINNSTLSPYTRSRGGFEFSFTYELTKEPEAITVETCPLL